MNREKHHL